MPAFHLSEDGQGVVLVVVLLVLQACVIVVDADDDDDFGPDDLKKDWVLETLVIDGRSYTIRSAGGVVGVVVVVGEAAVLAGPHPVEPASGRHPRVAVMRLNDAVDEVL